MRRACASCRLSRRKCEDDCPFRMLLPPDAGFVNEITLYCDDRKIVGQLARLDGERKNEYVRSLIFDSVLKMDSAEGSLGLVRQLIDQIPKDNPLLLERLGVLQERYEEVGAEFPFNLERNENAGGDGDGGGADGADGDGGDGVGADGVGDQLLDLLPRDAIRLEPNRVFDEEMGRDLVLGLANEDADIEEGDDAD